MTEVTLHDTYLLGNGQRTRSVFHKAYTQLLCLYQLSETTHQGWLQAQDLTPVIPRLANFVSHLILSLIPQISKCHRR